MTAKRIVVVEHSPHYGHVIEYRNGTWACECGSDFGPTYLSLGGAVSSMERPDEHDVDGDRLTEREEATQDRYHREGQDA